MVREQRYTCKGEPFWITFDDEGIIAFSLRSRKEMEAPVNGKPKSNGNTPAAKLAKVLAAKHGPFIDDMLAWFYGPQNTHTESWEALSAAKRADVAEVVEQTLRIDMGDRKGCEGRLGRIVAFAAKDTRFWQRNTKSLRSLRKDNGSGPKWSLIEGAMQQAEEPLEDEFVRPASRSADEVIAEL